MTTGDDLLRAIHADPDDDSARLVYADWLVERGDPLGEFVHVEHALATLPAFHPDRAAFVQRRLELFDAHLRAWWLGWFRWELMFPRFHRGFVESVHFGATQDFAAFDARMAELAGADHPLLRGDDDGRFPLVRRFGGLDLDRAWQLAPELRLREAVELRVIGTTLGRDAGECWRALASVRTTRVFHAFGCTDANGFDAILELPELVHVALERSRPVVEHLAAAGVPAHLRALSVDAGNAGPLRAALVAAGRPFVENAMPAAGELVLVTDPGRSPDLAFVEYPCVVTPDARAHPIPPALRELQTAARPPAYHAGWELRDQLAPGDAGSRAAHGVATPARADAVETSAYLAYPGAPLADVGLAIADRGPLYCRVGNLRPGQPVLGVWRLDAAAAPELTVIVGVEDIEQVMPVTLGERRWCNWVFAVPAELVRGTTLQLLVAGPRGAAFALYHAWFYQPG